MTETIEFLVNPSRTAMEQLGQELRAMVDSRDDLYVWRTGDSCHYEFAQQQGLEGKAWLYINPAKAEVVVSHYSHQGNVNEVAKHVRAHPKFKFFEVVGAVDANDNCDTYPEGS